MLGVAVGAGGRDGVGLEVGVGFGLVTDKGVDVASMSTEAALVPVAVGTTADLGLVPNKGRSPLVNPTPSAAPAMHVTRSTTNMIPTSHTGARLVTQSGRRTPK